jgi:transcriptional regulator with XRE-family HTH domain
MKLHFSRDWLKNKISSNPDMEVEACSALRVSPAAAPEVVMGERNVVQLRLALGVLVRQLRLRERLSIVELACKAKIAENELRSVEHDPHYTAKPYLLFQLSNFFDVPLDKLSQMAGATHVVNRSLYNDAVRYAARSDDLDSLTDEERRDLDAFVALLQNRE